MKAHDIRESFVDFFRERGHLSVPSAPLVPHGDPTLLFTNAGMVPFKSAFLGTEEPPGPRATSVQKCLRVSGKHNDLESVGPSPRHHTFFEMLGNFSFGDYFKEEAIRYAWELVTDVWELPVEHLYATVFEEDDEAEALWRKVSDLPEGRILRCGAKDNFWAMGETGPCGPSSEIHLDLDPDAPQVAWDEGTESGRYLELWNLVFMQHDRDADGELRPLPDPSIDTGAGLERLAAVLQGGRSNYDTDLFLPILRAAGEIAGVEYGADRERDVSLRVIADHLRATSFLLADGVIPGNEGRGYVLRRIVRRAVRHGSRLGFDEPFLHRLVPVLDEVMGPAYPELQATRDASVATVRAEEEKFLSTVAAGARQVQEEVEAARRAGLVELPGEAVFRLYDTHGLPVEVIREIAEEERMGFDEPSFREELELQRERSRSATGQGQRRMAAVARALREATEAVGSAAEEPGEPFVGYRSTEIDDTRVTRVIAEHDGEAVLATSLGPGETGVVVLETTPFYAESGGQVGDVGTLVWGAGDGAGGESAGSARVHDTKKDQGGTILHFVQVDRGTLTRGTRVGAAVDAGRRAAIERNHTATHLLHAALREVLGAGVRQAGSLVAPDRLRFDFTFARPLVADELREVETRVNRWVLAAIPTEIAERGYREAVAAGAMALFGEKYGDRVRTVAIPGASLELCGGCHVASTGQIGLVLLSGERGIASGVRRIEAVTGEEALARVRREQELLTGIAEALQTAPERAVTEIESLRAKLTEREEELATLRMEMVAGGAAGGAGAGGDDGVREVAGVKLLAREVPAAPAGELRNMADTLRSKLGSGVVVIGARDEGKVTLVAAVTDDLTDRVRAGQIVGKLARIVGGGGGGRPDFAQAGGKEVEKLDEALAAAAEAVAEQLA